METTRANQSLRKLVELLLEDNYGISVSAYNELQEYLSILGVSDLVDTDRLAESEDIEGNRSIYYYE